MPLTRPTYYLGNFKITVSRLKNILSNNNIKCTKKRKLDIIKFIIDMKFDFIPLYEKTYCIAMFVLNFTFENYDYIIPYRNHEWIKYWVYRSLQKRSSDYTLKEFDTAINLPNKYYIYSNDFIRDLKNINFDTTTLYEVYSYTGNCIHPHDFITFNDFVKSYVILKYFLEIEIKTPVLKLKYITSDETCSICLCENSNVKVTCGHPFHEKCITNWVNTSLSNNTCPYCRENIVTI